MEDIEATAGYWRPKVFKTKKTLEPSSTEGVEEKRPE